MSVSVASAAENTLMRRNNKDVLSNAEMRILNLRGRRRMSLVKESKLTRIDKTMLSIGIAFGIGRLNESDM